MVMFKQILLPTDFSELAGHAAPVARAMAEAFGATLHVLHVFESVPTAVPAPETGAAVMLLPPDEGELRDLLAAYVHEHFDGIRVPIVPVLLGGSRTIEIAHYAKEHEIDLIVIGTHARGVMNRLVFGSLSKSVLEHAHCSVLMVPPTAEGYDGQSPSADTAEATAPERADATP
jgi:nucleotide-binding universal stress UspA family protein